MSRPIGSVQRVVPSEDGNTGELVVTVLLVCDACGTVHTSPELHDPLCPARPAEEPAEPPVEEPAAWSAAMEANDGR